MQTVWLDCDPGHDDAFALILAATECRLLGVSTAAGNQNLEKTTLNALRVLALIGRADIPVVAGAAKPLLFAPRICPEIHGETGLDLPEEENDISERFQSLVSSTEEATKRNGIVFMHDCIAREPLQSVSLVVTGCLTNAALLLSVFPQIKRHLLQIVVLGGSYGGPWENIFPVAEFNIALDPHAAQIVFQQTDVKIVQIGLNVTHTALVSEAVVAKFSQSDSLMARVVRAWLRFFGKSYKEFFGMNDPPLHDPLAIAYVIDEALFKTSFWNLVVETKSDISFGQTVVDVFGLSKRPPNVHVCTKVDVERFFNLLAGACKKAEEKSVK